MDCQFLLPVVIDVREKEVIRRKNKSDLKISDGIFYVSNLNIKTIQTSGRGISKRIIIKSTNRNWIFVVINNVGKISH